MHQHIVFVLAIVVCTLYHVPLSMFFPVWTSLYLLTYLLRVIILDVTKIRERKREATPAASRRYHRKRRIKPEYLAVVLLLLPTSSLLPPSTVYVYHKALRKTLLKQRILLAVLNSDHCSNIAAKVSHSKRLDLRRDLSGKPSFNSAGKITTRRVCLIGCWFLTPIQPYWSYQPGRVHAYTI